MSASCSECVCSECDASISSHESDEEQQRARAITCERATAAQASRACCCGATRLDRSEGSSGRFVSPPPPLLARGFRAHARLRSLARAHGRRSSSLPPPPSLTAVPVVTPSSPPRPPPLRLPPPPLLAPHRPPPCDPLSLTVARRALAPAHIASRRRCAGPCGSATFRSGHNHGRSTRPSGGRLSCDSGCRACAWACSERRSRSRTPLPASCRRPPLCRTCTRHGRSDHPW